MKKLRGFRLGKKLSFLWRASWRPAKRRSYHRLVSEEPSLHVRRDSDERRPALAGKIIRWLRRCRKTAEEELCRRRSGAKPPPKGHLAVYVGRAGVDPLLYRVVLPVIFFNHPLFGELLRKTQEEFGFDGSGGIVIPCPISDFEVVRRRVAAAAGVRCRHCGKAEPWVWKL